MHFFSVYLLGALLVNDNEKAFVRVYFNELILLSLLPIAYSFIIVSKWKSNNWANHPLSIILSRYNSVDWTLIAQNISTEYQWYAKLYSILWIYINIYIYIKFKCLLKIYLIFALNNILFGDLYLYWSLQKLTLAYGTINRTVVTENWIISIKPYMVNVSKKSESSFLVYSSDNHNSTPDGTPGSIQFINIQVLPIRSQIKWFIVR